MPESSYQITVSYRPNPTLPFSWATQGRIRKGFYQLPPTADSLKKTDLLLLPIIELPI